MNHDLPSILAFGWVSHTEDILAVSLYTNEPRFAFYPCIWLSVTHTGHPGCVSIYKWTTVCLLSLHLVQCLTHGTFWLCLCIQLSHGLPSILAFGSVSHTRNILAVSLYTNEPRFTFYPCIWFSVSHTQDILAVSLYTNEPRFAFYPCIWFSVTHTGHPGCVSVYKWTTVCLLSLHLVQCHTHGTSWLCLCIQMNHNLPSILAFGWVSHTHRTSWLCLCIQMNHGFPSILAFSWVSHTRDILAVSLYTNEPQFAFYPCIWLSVSHTQDILAVSLYTNEPWFAFYPCIWLSVSHTQDILAESLYTNEPQFAFYPCIWLSVSHTQDILAVSLYTNEPQFAFYPCIWFSVTHTGHPGCVSIYKWTTVSLLSSHLVECHTHRTSWLCLCVQMNHGLPSIHAFGWVSHTQDILAVSLYTNEPRFAFYPCIWLSVSHTRNILAVSLYTNEPRFAFYPCIWFSVTHTGHPGCVSVYKWTTVCLLSLHLVECHTHGTSWLCLYIQMNHDLPSIHAFGWVSHTGHPGCVSVYKWTTVCLLSMHLVECHTHGTSWLCLYIQMNHDLPSILAFGWVSHTRDILAVSLYTNKPRFAFYPCIWLSVTHTGHPGCVSIYKWTTICLLSMHLVECLTHGTSWLCLCIQMNHGLPSILAFGWVSHTRDILAVSLYTNEPWFAFYPCIWLSVSHTGHPGCVSIYKWTTICLLSMHLVECLTHRTSWLCLCIQMNHGLPSILAFGWVSHTRDILAVSLYTNEPWFAFYPCIWLSVSHTGHPGCVSIYKWTMICLLSMHLVECLTHRTSWLCLYIQMNHGLPSIHAFGWVSHTQDILAVSLYSNEPRFAFYPCIWLSVSHTQDILAVSLYSNEPRFAFYPCIWFSVSHTGHSGCVSIQMNHSLPSILAFGWVSHTRDILAVSLYTNEPRFAFYPCIWLSVSHTQDILAVSLYTNEPRFAFYPCIWFSVTHTGHPGCVSIYKWTTICLLSMHLVECLTHRTSWLCLCIQMNHGLPSIHAFGWVSHTHETSRLCLYIQMNHGLPSILAFGWVSHTQDILAVSLYTNEPRFAFYPCIWLSVSHTGHPGCVSIYKWTTICLLSSHLVQCHTHGTSWLWLYIQMNHDLPSILAFGSVSPTRDILAVSLYTNEPRFAFYPCIWFSVTHTGHPGCVSIYKWTTICLLSSHLVQCHTHTISWLCLCIQMNHDLPSIHAFGSVSHTRDILAVSLYTNEPRFAFYPCIWLSVTHTGHPGCVSVYKWTTVCLLSMHLVECHIHGTSWLCLYIQMNHDLPSIHAFGSVSHTRDILAVSLYTNEPRFAFYPCIWFSVTHTGHPGCVSVYQWTTVCLLSLHLVECHTHTISWLCLYIQMNHGLPSIHAFGSVSHTRDILAVSLYTNEPRFAFYPSIWLSVTHTGHPGCVSI